MKIKLLDWNPEKEEYVINNMRQAYLINFPIEIDEFSISSYGMLLVQVPYYGLGDNDDNFNLVGNWRVEFAINWFESEIQE